MKSTFIVSYIIKKEENIMAKSMNDKELKEELLEELRCDLEEDLHGYVICDYLSRDDVDDILDSFDRWAETAGWGDNYVYDGKSYTLKYPEN
jgi:hypothetical protein